MDKSFQLCLALLKDSFQKKNFFLILNYNSTFFSFCTILKAENIILDLSHDTDLNLLKVSLKPSASFEQPYYDLPGDQSLVRKSYLVTSSKFRVLSKFIINSKPSTKTVITLSKLKKTESFCTLRILSTDKGLLTSRDCITKNLGGILICTL